MKQELDWKGIIAWTLAVCNADLWIMEVHKNTGCPVWHRIQVGPRTKCGGAIKYKKSLVRGRLETPPPPEDQCIVCQYGLSNLVEVEPPPKSEPPSPGPGGDYTPNPPTQALQVPVAMAS